MHRDPEDFMDSWEFSMESQDGKEKSLGLCGTNKYKLSNKPGQIQVLFRILFVGCGHTRTGVTPWRSVWM